MVHNIDCIGNPLDNPLIVRLESVFYAGLKVFRQRLGVFRRGVKHVSPVVAATGIGVLVDAQKDAPFNGFNGLNPVFQVRNL